MNLFRFLDNNSVFGRIMNRCGILIGANLLFLLCSLPVVTAGAGFAALYYTMMKVLRGDGNIRLFRTFWKGLRDNARQATAAWIGLLLLAGFVGLEIFWCTQFTGPVALFRYGLTAILIAELVLAIYLFPTMAAFKATLPQLVQNSIYFAFRNPLHLGAILFAHVAPVVLSYLLLKWLPLAAFLWCMIGFSAIAMFCSQLLLKEFVPYLPQVDICGDIIPEGMELPELLSNEPGNGKGRKGYDPSEEATIAEMLKYGL